MHQLSPVTGSSLEDVRSQFANWRRNRNPRSRIPSELWDAAVSLYPQYSINKIARALRLSHAELKKRIAARGLAPCTGSVLPAGFVELPMPPASQCTVEMLNRHGEKLRMEFSGEIQLDLMELSRSFRRPRS